MLYTGTGSFDCSLALLWLNMQATGTSTLSELALGAGFHRRTRLNDWVYITPVSDIGKTDTSGDS